MHHSVLHYLLVLKTVKVDFVDFALEGWLLALIQPLYPQGKEQWHPTSQTAEC